MKMFVCLLIFLSLCEQTATFSRRECYTSSSAFIIWLCRNFFSFASLVVSPFFNPPFHTQTLTTMQIFYYICIHALISEHLVIFSFSRNHLLESNSIQLNESSLMPHVISTEESVVF